MRVPEERTTDVDGIEFTCVKFGSRRGLRLAAQLIRIGGAPVVAIVVGDAPSAGEVADALVRLDPEAIDKFACAALSGSWAVVDGKRLELSKVDNIDVVFPDMTQLVKAVKFALEVNFRNFSEWLQALADAKAAPAAAAESSSA